MTSPFSAVLLAGGKSTRMGCDKALLKVGGVELWRRQLDTLRALEPRELFISGPPHLEWENADAEIIEDVVENSGPLAGVGASLQRCASPLLLVLAVDLPRMSSVYLKRLLDACALGRGIVPKSDGRFEPLAAIYPKLALPLAQNFLDSRCLSLQTFCARAVEESFVDEQPIPATDEALFLNANTPEDWIDARPSR